MYAQINPSRLVKPSTPVKTPPFQFNHGNPNPFVDMRYELDPAKIADALLNGGIQIGSRVEAQKRLTNILSSSDLSQRTIGIKALKIFLQRGGELEESCKSNLRLLHALEPNIAHRSEIEEIFRMANIPLNIS